MVKGVAIAGEKNVEIAHITMVDDTLDTVDSACWPVRHGGHEISFPVTLVTTSKYTGVVRILSDPNQLDILVAHCQLTHLLH